MVVRKIHDGDHLHISLADFNHLERAALHGRGGQRPLRTAAKGAMIDILVSIDLVTSRNLSYYVFPTLRSQGQ
jgi:hypothetical protein